MREQRGQADESRLRVDGGRLNGRDLVLAQRLADNIEAAGERGVAEGPSPERGDGIVPVSDFSGLVSSAWALASAPAMAPIESLERCIVDLRLHDFKADGAGLGALGPHARAGGLLRVLRHQGLEFGLGVFMLQKCRPGSAIEAGEFGPGIG
jgi:hypothetical protein